MVKTSYTELSKMTDLSYKSVFRIMTTGQGSDKTKKLLSDVTGIPIDTLFFNQDGLTPDEVIQKIWKKAVINEQVKPRHINQNNKDTEERQPVPVGENQLSMEM